MIKREYQAIVIGAGHAGMEAALALSRLGEETLLLTIEEKSVAMMPCNPNVGGTGKGHLVREIDALGGQMGLAADHSLLQIKMLNATKGAAVQSLRGQTDKEVYHRYMLDVIAHTPRLTLTEAEAVDLIVEEGKVAGVVLSTGVEIAAHTVVIASGVYLESRIIRGEESYQEGPSGLKRASGLSKALARLGVPIRRFKTGTPARIARDSIDYSKMEVEEGDTDVYCFSYLTHTKLVEQQPCYLTWTNERTHDIIRANIDRAPMYNGTIKGVGPRYCPSIEDKVMRFDHPRHQIFVEPETLTGDTMYIQGMSSSLPRDVQEQMYRTIPGLEHCRFVKYAYAIEYDCIDPLALYPSLETKAVKGLFTAGQVNGSSGYEEAAAQGLMAGINAHRYLEGKEAVVLGRDQAYIGVLIDDLVTRGTNEPYRMMTARAEYRLTLRQDNADRRLTPLGREIGLVDDTRWNEFVQKCATRAALDAALEEILPPKVTAPLLQKGGEVPKTGIKAKDIFVHQGVDVKEVYALPEFASFPYEVFYEAAIDNKYRGYLAKEREMQAEMRALEDKVLPADIDYNTLDNLRLEARQKLNAIRPRTLGQAARISGISPADVNVLIICLVKRGKEGA